MRKVNVGILGCGVISNTYIRDMKRFYKNLHIAACADVNPGLAKAHAEKYGIPAGCTPEELLAMEEVELIVNLTPPQLHGELNSKILKAGKHVFCEKPFALTVEEAKEVMNLAKEKNLLIGSAPDTFLGSSLQTCRKLLDDGWIGTPLYASANMTSIGVETWHPAPEHFYRKGAGPLYDMGPYYFTALAALLGPVKSVSAFCATGFLERNIYAGPRAGNQISVETPTHYSGVARLSSGVIVSLNLSFDIWHSSLPKMEIYGTEGTLEVPDPNMSGGKPRVYRKERTLDPLYDDSIQTREKLGVSVEIPELYPHIGDYTRGSGVFDLACAVAEGRRPRVNAEMACHVVEAITGMMESAETKKVYEMKTSCERPLPLAMGVDGLIITQK
ncbi:Gfo/Idh/MocA family protein [Lacrimispora sp.]|uniref:Gfo/Idh/MocA family protein n=1 Tax=Lacrimispora sp. TaxID=2719234 RepID=UPI00289D7A67|nr:Gfo/Idh/MocA family oxidoreductase [Lacrimispora sp.]